MICQRNERTETSWKWIFSSYRERGRRAVIGLRWLLPISAEDHLPVRHIGLLDAINMSRGCEWLRVLQIKKDLKVMKVISDYEYYISRRLKRNPDFSFCKQNFLLPSGKTMIVLSINALYPKTREDYGGGKKAEVELWKASWLWQFFSSPLPSLTHFWSTTKQLQFMTQTLYPNTPMTFLASYPLLRTYME